MESKKIEFMTVAGAFFSEEDQSSRCGEIRLRVGDVQVWIDGEEVTQKGFLVQQFVEVDDDQYGWTTVCPLSDAHFLLKRCPKNLASVSRSLRKLIEQGEKVTLDIERTCVSSLVF